METNPDLLIKKNPQISSLPETCFLINEMVNDPNSSFGDVARIINLDTSLSARLLRIVNSPFYCFPQRVETITHAISIIGTEQLRDLALATSVISKFEGIDTDQVDMNAFWRHSVGVGIASRVTALNCRQTNSERFFLLGILHDIGRLILLENYPREMKPLLQAGREEGPLLVELETRTFGFHHGELGAALCRAWNLSPLFVEVVGCHHHPQKATAYPLETGVLHLGNLLTKAMQLGSSGEEWVPPLDETVWERLGLGTGHLEGICEQVRIQFEDTVQIVLTG